MKELLELAKLYGIQTSYIDMAKRRQDADPEALLLVLRAMGVSVEDFGDVPTALRDRKEELKKRKVEPVMVAWDGKLGRRRFEFGYHDTEIDGQPTFVISAPTQAYSPLQQEAAAKRQVGVKTSSAISTSSRRAPRASPSKTEKHWGMFVPVYALHSRRTPYAGDLDGF